ncbi:MAG: hypothetical protein JW928_09015 [Candidatus Aureabacteria bacterium]|nr:hypothetical protein [Candidatus Auribacterota bacterium]
MGKIIKIIVVLIIAAFLIRFLYPLFLSDEDKIKRILKETAEKTEKRSAFTFMKHFDKKFSDDSGLDFEGIRYMGIRIMQMYKELDVEYEIKNIEVDHEAEKAILEMDLFITVTESGTPVDIIHGARNSNRFIVTLEKSGRKWAFVKSEKP